MSAFDTTLRVSEDVQFVPEADENGRAVQATMLLTNIMLLPVGPGQMMGLPAGLYRIPMTKAGLRALIKSAQEIEETLVEPSDLAIASDMRSVEGFARQQESLRG